MGVTCSELPYRIVLAVVPKLSKTPVVPDPTRGDAEFGLHGVGQVGVIVEP